MTSDPFLAKLKAQVAGTGGAPGTAAPAAAPPQDAARAPAADVRQAAAPGRPVTDVTDVNPSQLGFWQSKPAMAAIAERITGRADVTPWDHFVSEHGAAVPTPLGLALRSGDGVAEKTLVRAGICERIVGLDDDDDRIDSANGRLPGNVAARVHFERGDVLTWETPAPVGLVVSHSFLHRRSDLEAIADRLTAILAPGGLLCVEEYIGPPRQQWTDAQIGVINGILGALPPALRVDLTRPDQQLKDAVGRPDPQRFSEMNPHEAVRSDEIVGILDAHFDRVEHRPYGGAVYHQLFARIMGNFAGRPDLVRAIMDVDALLTDSGILEPDYLWAVWRRREPRPGAGLWRSARRATAGEDRTRGRPGPS